ncbi:calcium-binding protein CP1-like [Silene latifolia]|uniref:calcium-binding protein CP1-like n=1 Tax=Silene latifolia TaxID=37657 RepID=UPI003D78453D
MCPTGTTLRPKQISNDDKPDFRQAFAVMDADHDGKISSDDLRVFYAAVGDGGQGHAEDDMIKAMINVADSNKDGFVQYDEFEGVLSTVEKGESGGDGGVMEELFKVMDSDCDGRLGVDDLRSYLKLSGIYVDDDEIKGMILLGGGSVFDGVDFNGFLTILNLHY